MYRRGAAAPPAGRSPPAGRGGGARPQSRAPGPRTCGEQATRQGWELRQAQAGRQAQRQPRAGRYIPSSEGAAPVPVPVPGANGTADLKKLVGRAAPEDHIVVQLQHRPRAQQRVGPEAVVQAVAGLLPHAHGHRRRHAAGVRRELGVGVGGRPAAPHQHNLFHCTGADAAGQETSHI